MQPAILTASDLTASDFDCRRLYCLDCRRGDCRRGDCCRLDCRNAPSDFILCLPYIFAVILLVLLSFELIYAACLLYPCIGSLCQMCTYFCAECARIFVSCFYADRFVAWGRMSFGLVRFMQVYVVVKFFVFLLPTKKLGGGVGDLRQYRLCRPGNPVDVLGKPALPVYCPL